MGESTGYAGEGRKQQRVPVLATTVRQLLFISLALACTPGAHAAEGGVTHYLPGGTATLIDLAPTKPGWVVEPIYAPTGEYETGRLANPGLNYWTFDPTAGVSYNNDKNGLNAALHLGLSFNTENHDTDYQSGTLFHLEASAQQLLPVGPGFLGVGAEAFYLQQVSGV